MLWLLCLLAYVALVLACDQWDRTSLRRWHAGRDTRRAENRAWCDAQHARRLARWEADGAHAARWATYVTRHPRLAHLLPWGVAVLIFLGLTALGARLS